MKLFLKTPLYQNSKFIPHLLEHCIGNNIDEDIFFQIIYQFQGICFAGYLKFSEILDMDLFLNLIKAIPTKNKINYEIQVMKDEFENNSYLNIIGERIGKKLYCKDYRTNSCGKISWKNIYNYHTKYFQNPSYIITDNEYKLISHNLILNEYHGNEIGKINKMFIKYYRKTDKIIYLQITHYLEIYYMNFIYELLCSYHEYNERYQNCKYSYASYIRYYTFPDYIGIGLPDEQNFEISNSFFNKCKNYFLTNLINHNDIKELHILSMLLLNEKSNIEKVKIFIGNLKYEDIINILIGYKVNILRTKK